MLNFEPDLAVELFLESLREAEPILGTMIVQPFLYHAVFSHYEVLRELLLTMLHSPDAEVRETAAQQIALASFGIDEARADLVEVFSGDEVCRAAVAKVDAENLHVQECMLVSRARLKEFFWDESPRVRKHAAQCFARIGDEQLCQEPELIDAFLQSPAFHDNANTLIMALKNSVARLPDVVCRIPERAVELHKAASSNEARWWTNQMAPLVLRLHEQTTDPIVKIRCLDVIDAMIELNFGSVSFELAKLES
jgi:HEAT repeat protein